MDDQLLERDQSAYADGLVEGEYLHERRGHVAMPVRVWWGPPLDLEHGGFMDRSPRWNVTLAGVPITPDERVDPKAIIARLEDVWPKALNRRVNQPELAYRDARIDHARRHDPRDPYGERRGKIDLLTARPTF